MTEDELKDYADAVEGLREGGRGGGREGGREGALVSKWSWKI